MSTTPDEMREALEKIAADFELKGAHPPLDPDSDEEIGARSAYADAGRRLRSLLASSPSEETPAPDGLAPGLLRASEIAADRARCWPDYAPTHDSLRGLAMELRWMAEHHGRAAPPASPGLRAEVLEEAAQLCERVRCRTWSPEECARQIRALKAASPAPSPRSPEAAPNPRVQCSEHSFDMDPCILPEDHAGPHRYRSTGGYDYSFEPGAPAPSPDDGARKVDAFESLIATLRDLGADEAVIRAAEGAAALARAKRS